jgi:hypothetical protein
MQGHVAIAAPEGRRATPNYSLKARVLRIKQTNGLNFSTALPTSPRRLPILPLGLFFMKFRGPQALSNRRRKTIVCATEACSGISWTLHYGMVNNLRYRLKTRGKSTSSMTLTGVASGAKGRSRAMVAP